MSITRHTDPHVFLAAASPIVERSESTAVMFASIVSRLLAEPPPADERLYLATFDDGVHYGAAIQRRENAVRVEDSDAEAAIAFARDLANEAPKLQGVVGSLASCEAFAREWKRLTGRSHALRVHLCSHVLTEVAAVPKPRGAIRVATEADVEWLGSSQTTFLRDARMPDDVARVRASLPGRIARHEMRIWDDGGAVAFAGWSSAGTAAARIGPVWTEASARRRGYATALVAALARELLADGRTKIFLDTDLANPTSNAIYARIGFRPLQEFYHFDFVAS